MDRKSLAVFISFGVLAALACGRDEGRGPVSRVAGLVQGKLRGRPVLKVEKREYYNADLRGYLEATGADAKGLPAESLSRLFDRFVDEMILLEAARERGIALTEDEKREYLAKKLRLRSVDRTEHRVVFKFRPETPVDWSRVTPLLKRFSGSLTPEGVLSLAFRGTTEKDLLDETVGVLMELSK